VHRLTTAVIRAVFAFVFLLPVLWVRCVGFDGKTI